MQVAEPAGGQPRLHVAHRFAHSPVGRADRLKERGDISPIAGERTEIGSADHETRVPPDELVSASEWDRQRVPPILHAIEVRLEAEDLAEEHKAVVHTARDGRKVIDVATEHRSAEPRQLLGDGLEEVGDRRADGFEPKEATLDARDPCALGIGRRQQKGTRREVQACGQGRAVLGRLRMPGPFRAVASYLSSTNVTPSCVVCWPKRSRMWSA